MALTAASAVLLTINHFANYHQQCKVFFQNQLRFDKVIESLKVETSETQCTGWAKKTAHLHLLDVKLI